MTFTPPPQLLSERFRAADAMIVKRAGDELYMAILLCCPPDVAQGLADEARALGVRAALAVRDRVTHVVVRYEDDPRAAAEPGA